jgi:flagellar capping protein FliD
MIATDEDALLCDLAETYGIFDLNALPVETLAALSFGLRENSRIKRKMAGALEVDEMELLSVIADNLTLIRSVLLGQELSDTALTSMCIRKQNRPQAQPIYKFKSSEDFREAWDNV